jgi:membrane protease YdiL (CAAX protease family)
MGFSVPVLVGHLFARAGAPSTVESAGRIAGLIMSCGAGFYEELAFRVVLFGLGGKLLVWLFAHERVDVLAGTDAKPKRSFRAALVLLAWGLIAAVVFSAIHYIGPMGDTFQLASFVARAMLGAILTLVFVARGFAIAVWTHALYDMWILVVRA